MFVSNYFSGVFCNLKMLQSTLGADILKLQMMHAFLAQFLRLV